MSVAELEKRGLFQTVGCGESNRLYHLIQNKGFRYLGWPDLKQAFDREFINVCGDSFNMKASKQDTFLMVNITIV